MPISTIGANGLNKTEDFTIDGLTVGKGGGNVSNNTVVGLNAGVANTTGKITAVGYLAARFNTTGSGNTAIGGNDGAQDGALYLNTTGNYNIAMGTGAVASNTTGSNNTGIGYSALQNSTTADNNTAVGYTAMYTNTTGQGNTALGRRALYSNTTASDNTAIGNQALYTNSTGTANVAVGQNALVSNTTATRNTAVGYQAGYALTTGGANVVVGDNAFKTATTADNTVAIGTYALENTTGIYNTAVGAGAGGAITSGAKNTIIGRYNGNQGGLDIRTASSYIVLSDGDGNPELIMGGGYNALTNQQIITSNTKGGTVNILSRAQVFPTDNTITSAILLITAVASEGTGGGYTRSDVVFISKRFGNQIAQTNIGASDGISLSTWTYGFDGSNFRVTQNWGAGGSTLGTRWSILVVSGANAG